MAKGHYTTAMILAQNYYLLLQSEFWNCNVTSSER